MILLLMGCQPTTPTSHPLPPRVLVLTPEQYTFGQDTTIHALIEAAGGVNAAATLNGYQQLNDSQIIQLKPDIILFSSTWDFASIDHWQQAPVYAELPAIRHARLYQLDFSLAESDLQAHYAERLATLQMLFDQRN